MNAFQAAWAERVADIPVRPGKSILPAMDGDIAWLHHLRAEIRRHRQVPMFVPAHDLIWVMTVVATGVDPDEVLGQWEAA